MAKDDVFSGPVLCNESGDLWSFGDWTDYIRSIIKEEIETEGVSDTQDFLMNECGGSYMRLSKVWDNGNTSYTKYADIQDFERKKLSACAEETSYMFDDCGCRIDTSDPHCPKMIFSVPRREAAGIADTMYDIIVTERASLGASQFSPFVPLDEKPRIDGGNITFRFRIDG